MVGKLKKLFPEAYEYYLHLIRREKIREINTLKKMPKEKYSELLGRLFEQKIGHKLDWNNLKTYTEKMQWEKLYDDNPLKVTLSDKFLAREWVAKKIGADYLIPCLGVWDSFDSINFSMLPDKFVLKTNHGSGTNVIVKDKQKIKIKQIKQKFDDWMATDFGFNTGFELHYSNIKPKIIAEKYLETNYGELQDYKFLCFDGKPYFCWVDMGRYTHHTRNVYDLNWNLQPWHQAYYGIYKEPIPQPPNFKKMVELATVLSQGFSHVRVDLYNVDGIIYFGEMTFTNGSGLDPIIPTEYDRMLGSLWNLPMTQEEKT